MALAISWMGFIQNTFKELNAMLEKSGQSLVSACIVFGEYYRVAIEAESRERVNQYQGIWIW